MIERFQGGDGHRRLLAALTEHRIVANQRELAEQLVAAGELIEVAMGEPFITQGEHATDVFFIIAGSVEVRVNNKIVANRFAGDHVGEMSAVEPINPRAATVIARKPLKNRKIRSLSVLVRARYPSFDRL